MENSVERIQLSHGGGGRLMHQLVRDYFVPTFDLQTLNDSAVVEGFSGGKIALTTDSYVISPYFFPGGDIGMLSVCGTVNDLSMAGAKPLYLTTGFILEEGMPIEDLKKILASMKTAAYKAGINIVAGDTKVVEKGKGDGIYINTAGIGIVDEGIDLSPNRIRPGDKIILSGSIGNHGMAVMAERNGISFEPPLLSDVCALNRLVETMLATTREIRVLRDPTRGGVATTLKEFAADSACCMMIDEEAVCVRPGVQGACDLLGLDPLYVANEGILLAVVDARVADELVRAMKKTKEGAEASVIGEVSGQPSQMVLLRTKIGGTRIIDMITGEQLPRIC
ncbi:MAG: hydrogenase expression/formation protein HypE [Nitrospirae bacterium]|nr:hydrogenase expression/formation protein HypE [Nitrospirota bacterium]